MPTVRALPIHGTESAEPYDETVFVSLEDTPIVLADIRAALPQLREELAARWPINRVEIENRRPARRRNPYDPSQVEAVLGIVIGLFFFEATRAAGKKIGEAAGEEVGKYVRSWIQGIAHTLLDERTGPTRPGLPHHPNV
jgi:uncharacterized protein YcfJ